MSSKDKESARLSQQISSSRFSIEVYYTVPIDDKPTKYEFEMIGKGTKMTLLKNREEIIMKMKMKV